MMTDQCKYQGIFIKCAYCGVEYLACMIQGEHPIPRSVGGQKKTVPVCANCHAKKVVSHDFKLFGWKSKLGSYQISAKCAVCGYTGLIGVDVVFHHIVPRALGVAMLQLT